MDPVTTGLTALGLLIFFLGSGMWIFSALAAVGFCVLYFVLGFPVDRIGQILKTIFWRSGTSWEIAAIPMFILMGELIFRADISGRIFRGLAPLVEWLPGRLLHTNIAGCTLFAMVSGSSAATTATIGKITIDALRERGYDDRLAIGSLAGAGSLGLLVPPSIVMIIYGILAEVSIARLFAAGLIPGLMLASMLSGYIGLACLARPQAAPSAEARLSSAVLLRSLWDLGPMIVLVACVLGGIYTGLATPSQAAAIGVVIAIVLAAAMGKLTFRLLSESLLSTVSISSMICSIIVAAAFLSTAIGFAHLPQELAAYINGFDLSPYALILALAVFYLIMGCFLDGISMTVMSLPVTLPLAVQAGWDPIWFGIFLVVMIEMAQVTPPVGFNLFVIQGLTGWSIYRIARATIPFFLVMCAAMVIFTMFPEIVLWLPRMIW